MKIMIKISAKKTVMIFNESVYTDCINIVIRGNHE
jgi:hypothetical protein